MLTVFEFSEEGNRSFGLRLFRFAEATEHTDVEVDTDWVYLKKEKKKNSSTGSRRQDRGLCRADFWEESMVVVVERERELLYF